MGSVIVILGFLAFAAYVICVLAKADAGATRAPRRERLPEYPPEYPRYTWSVRYAPRTRARRPVATKPTTTAAGDRREADRDS